MVKKHLVPYDMYYILLERILGCYGYVMFTNNAIYNHVGVGENMDLHKQPNKKLSMIS
jgi:hypothetical protein